VSTHTSPQGGSELVDRRFAAAIVLLALLAASLTQIVDNDTYMHLSLGRLIVDVGGLPEHEPFSYPSENEPFSYSSWLFGVTLHLLYAAGGGVLLTLFKALLIWATMAIVLADSATPRARSPWLALAAVVVAYTMVQDRYVLRPELVGVLCLAASVWLLDRFWYLDDRRGLYAIPAIAWLWANSHSSIPLGFLVFGAFVLGTLVHHGARGRVPCLEPVAAGKLGPLLVTAGLSFGSSLVSPYGIEQYQHAMQYHEVLWYQQSIIELRGIEGAKLRAHVAFLVVVVASFVVARRRVSVSHLVLITPLLAMPFQSTRYTLFAVVVGMPVVVRNLAPAVDSVRARWARAGLAALPAAALVALAALLLPISDIQVRRAPFGLGLYEHHRMKGAAEFLREQGVRGRVLNDFNTGTYLIWHSYPDLTVFIESRGYVPPRHLEDAQQYLLYPERTERLFAEYGFQIIVAENPWGGVGGTEAGTRVRDGLTGIDPARWALTFWDDHALVFLRRDGDYATLATHLEYRHAKPDRSLSSFLASLPARSDGLALEQDLRRALAQERSLYARSMLALLYSSSGRYAATVELLGDVAARTNGDVPPQQRRFIVEILADAHAGMGEPEDAARLYRQALSYADDNLVHYKLARLYQDQGQTDEAISHLEKAAALAPRHLPTQVELAILYAAHGDAEAADSARRTAEALRARGSMQMLLREGVKAHMAGDYARAETLYLRVLEAGPDATTLANLAFLKLDTGRAPDATARFQAALAADPQHANAHYGLALTAGERGDVAAQIEHFRRYLELEPEGYFHRQAVAELKRLGAR
jgi:tetratricopeptide (TPR) repeat protein